ncbi:hypothetical protein FDI14_gp089 [Mycobacterium phage SirDuracell]|uniref:Uncharacterized protein n=5 Tax=Caudoviricetes TaxID=2731619 RepID=B5A650_9CAUD|nr:hypothetical protein Porky_88 [Mycobacterium phage Porky]YP_008052022.1 hypothetical protein PBI_PHRUX_86 [Mycobacterium phage Phrux]YP_008531168.1 hypothetical protein P755_gp092 [Mycobacterium phage Quink]YP_008857580.1 hypothetical protein PHATBACTER_93 [Mycobacterium phage PhatBacter]YP_008858371.1 hypothetical protein NALA_91 [Mycobacterium phage Nala]YP_009591249.1 hypothetical protein FDG56_gp089 [Mycobacterium phage Bask21]YP_009608019.1 hypothetical protein FDI14_gp089 [Mycobacter
MAHGKHSWFHDWEWDGYRLRRCTRCNLCQEQVEFGLLHNPPREWRETVKANNHFAAVDRARAQAT